VIGWWQFFEMGFSEKLQPHKLQHPEKPQTSIFKPLLENAVDETFEFAALGNLSS
jgi:hypothetical protein